MVDIHCHILPGLDDGARSMDEALDMADIAVESGVTLLCATPHTNQQGHFYNYESRELQDAYQEFLDAIDREKIPLEVVRGAEIYVTNDVIKEIERGRVSALNGTNYYLMEFAFDEPDWFIEHSIAMVFDLGKIPVLAHPERYYCVQDHPSLLYEWMQMGVLSQVNKGSILGRFGSRSEKTADTLMDHHLVTCIASDAHNPFRRTTDMRGIRAYIDKHYSPEYRELLMQTNPEKLLRGNGTVQHLPPIPFESKKLYWR